MEPNPRLAIFKSLIGQSMTSSPSGVGRWLGGVLREVEEGRIVADYVVTEQHLNPMQTLHGGTVAAILDDLCGLTVFAMGREYGYTSVNMNVDFLSAARLGEILTTEAVVVRAGRNIVHVEGKITNAAGKLIAKCSTNLIQTMVKL